MIRTQIYLPDAQRNALRKLAHQKRLTISAIVRQLLQEGLRGKQTIVRRKSGAQALFDILEEVKSYGESGPEDLASNLDEYLYGGKK